MPQIKASPQNATLAQIAAALRSGRDLGNKIDIPVLGGLGSMLLGRAPEEVEDWSYGNAPMRVPEMSNVPQFKPGRADTVADTLFAAQGAAPLAALARRGATSAGLAVGRAAERQAERMIPGIMAQGGVGAQILQDLVQGSKSQVIKQKGGNWLAGSVEDALRGLRADLPREEARQTMQGAGLENYDRNAALNSWIDKQLARYVKNEMATPEDPVRALAERGVLHVDPGRVPSKKANEIRAELGTERLGSSPMAKKWEDLSDQSLMMAKAGEMVPAPGMKSIYIDANPWLRSVAPDAPVSGVARGEGLQPLGFSHLLDELRNATNPASGLPLELQLKYSSLPQVSVPQAVERVAKINEWRAAQKVAADQARANNAATVLHKEYPDAGFKWVELKAPEGTSSAYLGNKQFEAPEANALQDALKYEGDTMGHCVGGYCPDVLEGRSRIFSLRSAKGEPHVTVEVAPTTAAADTTVANIFPDLHQEWKDLAPRAGFQKWLGDVHPDAYEQLKGIQRIVQIKGKANRAPNAEYLPYVQGFVKSGQWSDVGDLSNTGLRRIGGKYFSDPEIQAAMDTAGFKFPAKELETDYYENLLRNPAHADASDKALFEALGLQPKYASGGSVTTQTEYDPQRIDAIVEQLRGELAAQ